MSRYRRSRYNNKYGNRSASKVSQVHMSNASIEGELHRYTARRPY